MVNFLLVLVKVMPKPNKEPFFNGCISSLISCIILQPFDITKTQIQESSNQVNRVPYVTRRNSLYSIVRQMYSRGGMFSFWKGISKGKNTI